MTQPKGFWSRETTIPGKHNPSISQDLKQQPANVGSGISLGAAFPPPSTTGNSVLHSQGRGLVPAPKNLTTNGFFWCKSCLCFAEPAIPAKQKGAESLWECHSIQPPAQLSPRQKQCLLPASTADRKAGLVMKDITWKLSLGLQIN